MNTKKITLRDVWNTLVKPESSQVNSKKHVSEIERNLTRWETFWDGSKQCRVSKIERQHVDDWKRHLIEFGLAPRSVNKHIATIRLLLIAAEDHNIIKKRPRLAMMMEPKHQTKLYLRNEQIDSLFATSDRLRWPATSISTGDWWRCALILYRTYGFRSQELVAYETGKKPITWSNISFDHESPDLDSREMCLTGWLHYIPPKTAKSKPSPICIPLTQYTRGAVNVLLRAKKSDHDPIMNNPRNQERFFETWNAWMKHADVQPKNQEKCFQPRHLRKTCATYMNQFKPGLASAICLWGTISEATVAQDHYISNDLLLREIHNAPMPDSFSWALQYLDQ